MDPDKKQKLLELSARYASAARASEARRGGGAYHIQGDKRTEDLQGERFASQEDEVS
jgi:hypothetical protein